MNAPNGFANAGVHPPKTLRDAAARAASRPGRPLLAPGARAAFVVAIGLVALAIFVVGRGLRANAHALGLALTVVPAALLVLAGAALLALALREAVPGRAVASAARRGAFITVLVLLVVLAEWLARGGAGSRGGLPPLICYPLGLAVASPAIVLFGWLLFRAYPLRPVAAAALGALGAGLLADASLHLTCPATSLAHTLFVHGGAVATLALAGAAAGLVLSARRSSRAL